MLPGSDNNETTAHLGEDVTNAANHRLQQTLAGPVKLEGPGLFHGIHARLRLLPADVNSGISFCRTDLSDRPVVPARHDFVLNAPRRTVLGRGTSPLIETTEHLLAALAGLGVDNCLVELDAPEVPSFDASSRVFCDAILETGLETLTEPIHSYSVTGNVIRQADGGQSLVLRPYVKPLLAVTWKLDYGSRAVIPAQVYSAEITPEFFVREIAAARTFVLESEIKALRSLGYGQHLTQKDLLIAGDDGTWNNRLRWPDECVRHKLLDCVGDLALSGLSICGHVAAVRSGHKLNHQLAGDVAQLAEQKTTPFASGATATAA